MNKKLGFGVLGAFTALGTLMYWGLTVCSHNFSRPFAWKKGKLKINYVVCLKCGKEFRYDMDKFKVMEQIKLDSHDVVGSPHVV